MRKVKTFSQRKKSGKIRLFFHKNIICRLTDNAAIHGMGVFGGIRYNLGIARPGIDFVTLPGNFKDEKEARIFYLRNKYPPEEIEELLKYFRKTGEKGNE